MIALVHKQKKKSGDGSITFPALQCLNPVTGIATFVAELDGERINCKISLNDLNKFSGVFPDDAMQLINHFQHILQTIATKHIKSNKFEEDGSVLITIKDLKQYL